MRATDGLQTTITLGSVKPHGQAFALELALEISLPMPRQDEHLPDQIAGGRSIRPVSLEVQRRLFQVLIAERPIKETRCSSTCTAKPALASMPGDMTFHLQNHLREATVERSRISHNQDGTIEIPSATVWNTSTNWPSPRSPGRGL